MGVVLIYRPHPVHTSGGRGRGGGALILDRCRAFDLFASVDAHLSWHADLYPPRLPWVSATVSPLKGRSEASYNGSSWRYALDLPWTSEKWLLVWDGTNSDMWEPLVSAFMVQWHNSCHICRGTEFKSRVWSFFHDDILGSLGSNLVFIIPFGIL